MKFSIIIPVYNVESYVVKCLESVNNQSYTNYEAIIVNDGSTDNSKKLIKDYIKNKPQFKYYEKENGGLSDARNYGLKYISGDYIIFVDSDDYLSLDLLQNLNNILINHQYEVIRFNTKIITDSKVILNPPLKQTKTIIKSILSNHFVEPIWLYCFNANFWRTHNFSFTLNRIHEDFGLLPIILSKTKSIEYLNYYGYNYVERSNSIMNQITYEKLKRRTRDFQYFFLQHRQIIKPISKNNKLILSFSAQALIYKSRELMGTDLDDMYAFLRQEKVVNQIYPDSFKLFLQKIYLKLFLKHRLIKTSKEFQKETGVIYES